MIVHRNVRGVEKGCFIGAGVVGGIFSAVMAKKIPSFRVTVVDKNPSLIKAWNSASPPVLEPGLAEIVAATRRNFHFSEDVDEGIADADIIFLCVNTPPKGHDEGPDLQLDINNVENVIRKIASVAKSNKIIVDKSTVPVGSAQHLRDLLRIHGTPGVQFEVLSNPEFLVTGRAIETAMNPDRVLIGSTTTETGLRAAEILANLYNHWVPSDRIIMVNNWSAELAKLAANAMLAQRVSDVNALSALCERTGAQINEVSHAVGADHRLGFDMLRCSFGFGGSCFWKDIRCLIYLCRSLNMKAEANLWQAILQVNEAQQARAIDRITSVFNEPSLHCRRIACLGFAFKENTGDTRMSPSIQMIEALLGRGATICVYDSFISEDGIRAALPKSSNTRVEVCPSAPAACANADAVVVMTECEEFRTRSSAINYVGTRRNGCYRQLDWEKVSKTMKVPKAVFGSSQFLNGPLLRSWGFRTELLGDGSTCQ